jgi:RND superfamily putative drug exporter
MVFARAVTGHPKTVLAVWAVLVSLSTPFALRVSEVLTQQGASKVVQGTRGAAVANLVRSDFPTHSEREAVVVLQGWDQSSLQSRQLLAVLDGAIVQTASGARVRQTVSAYTAYRDATAAYVEGQLTAAGLGGTHRATVAERAALVARLAAQKLPKPLTDLILASQGATQKARTALAGDTVVAADWHRLPVPAPPLDILNDAARTTLISVSYDATGPDPRTDDLRATVSTVIRSLGLQRTVTAHVTGEIPLLQDTYARAEADNARMEQVAYLVVALVLLLFFRAVVPAVVTVAVIGLAMNVSQAWLYLIGGHVQLTQFTSTIMTFVMLGAGIDYSMLLSSRYRQERLAGRTVHEAAVHATARAGESVVLAGSAVVLSFGATLLSPVDWIPPLGYGGLVGIPIILLAALTITPSLLVLLGDRFFWLGVKPLSDMESRGALSTSLRRVISITRACPLLVVMVFAIVTVPVIMTVQSHPLSADPVALSPETDSRRGAEVVTSTWGPGYLFPTVVAGRLGPGDAKGGTLTAAGETRLARLTTTLAADPGVAQVTDLTHPFGTTRGAVTAAKIPPQVREDYLSAAGAVRIVVNLRGDPFSPAARATVDRLESIVHDVSLPTLRVGGATQVDAEYDSALVSSFWKMIAVVAAGIFVLLLVALKSVLIPIRLILTIMMSNAWAIAITVLVFRVHQGAAVINDLPVFLVILMMGLGMDYEIFLITRVRDLVRAGQSDADATGNAVIDTGRVITAAGLVMAGSLGTMMLSSTLMLQQYGLGLGAAVLLDATLVRMFFVPASLMLLRRANWWVPSLPRLRLRTS